MKNAVSFLTLFSTSILMTVAAHAAPVPVDPTVDRGYFTVSGVSIEEVKPAGTNPLDTITKPAGPAPTASGGGTDPTVALDQIINIGKEVWSVIAANKPVVDVQTDTANAVPAGITDWERLSGWQAPQTREFQVSYKNLYGMSVVNFTFRILYTPGGTLNGQGAYLANASIVPAALSVAWGYTFNAQNTVASVTNAGTEASPVAALQMQLHWTVDTVLSHEEETDDFYIKGDGSFQSLGSSL